jgi:prepilin-type N-terminal cleavage/methylation domain-containing protein
MNVAQRYRSAGGFSLLEVLVASAVLGVVMLVLLNTLSTSMSIWRNTEGRAVADREARASGMLLAQDLGSIYIPANTNLWPTVLNIRGANREIVTYLKFLTTKPSEYQAGSGNDGDVCYVEYAIVPSTNAPGNELRRLFWSSKQTYDTILSKTNAPFPSSDARSTNFQTLGLSLLPTNNMAVRGSPDLFNEANNTNFVLLGTNKEGKIIPFTGNRTAANYPVAVEVNFAVADPDTLRNTNLLRDPKYILRNAGLYSTQFYLPKPPNAQ